MNIFDLVRGAQKLVMPNYYFEYLAEKREKEKFSGYWHRATEQISRMHEDQQALTWRLVRERDEALCHVRELQARVLDLEHSASRRVDILDPLG